MRFNIFKHIMIFLKKIQNFTLFKFVTAPFINLWTTAKQFLVNILKKYAVPLTIISFC